MALAAMLFPVSDLIYKYELSTACYLDKMLTTSLGHDFFLYGK